MVVRLLLVCFPPNHAETKQGKYLVKVEHPGSKNGVLDGDHKGCGRRGRLDVMRGGLWLLSQG